MTTLATALLLLGTAAATGAAIAPGDHLFVHARVLDCGDATYIVDYAKVDEDGQAVFANGLRLGGAGRSAECIATSIAASIGRATGRTPKTLRVEVVAGDDWERLRHNVLAMREASRCEAGAKKPEPGERGPAEGYNRRLADAH